MRGASDMRSTIYVCMACGKTSETREGLSGVRNHGWDASCAVNAVLCYTDSIERDKSGRVLAADAVEKTQETAT